MAMKHTVAVVALCASLAWPAHAEGPSASVQRLNAYALDLEQELKSVMVKCSARRVELDTRAQRIQQLEQEVNRLTRELTLLKNPPQEE